MLSPLPPPLLALADWTAFAVEPGRPTWARQRPMGVRGGRGKKGGAGNTPYRYREIPPSYLIPFFFSLLPATLAACFLFRLAAKVM